MVVRRLMDWTRAVNCLAARVRKVMSCRSRNPATSSLTEGVQIMALPEQVNRAVRQRWGIDANAQDAVSVKELKHDWVIVRRLRDGKKKTVGLRLIVPKYGRRSFEIPDGAQADDEHGISSEYQLLVEGPVASPQKAAAILAKHTGMSSEEASNILKTGGRSAHAFYIGEPLQLIRELGERKVRVRLLRTNDRGGYVSD